MSPAPGRRVERRFRVYELPLLLGLVVLWMMLWGEISWMSFGSGILIALLATRLYYLPPVELAGRFNVWWAIRYLWYFFTHLSLASLQVAWQALGPGPRPVPAVIEVRLRTRSDFILTMTSLTLSLIPGSLVAEVDRFGSTLYLHVLHAPTHEAIERVRWDAHHVEELLIRTIGSREEVGKLP